MITITEKLDLIRYDASTHRRSYGVLRHYDVYISGRYMGSVEGKHALSNLLMRLRALVSRNVNIQRALARARKRLTKMGHHLLLAGLVLLTGCATIVKGTAQTISLSTPPVAGADCQIKSAKGSWHVVTPGVVTVPKSRSDLTLQCKKDGHSEAMSAITPSVEPWILGNILIGGIIGLVVDMATGAINTYPSTYQLPLYEKKAAL